jgi:glycosyltransferase 2 family protein
LPDAQKVGKKEQTARARHQASGRARLAWIARILVATGAILWVFRGQDWEELAAVFRRLSPWSFVLSLAVFAVAQVIIGLRWWLLLRAQSIHIQVQAAVRLYFLGLFYNNVMPGSVGGDLLKAWYVTKHTDRKIAGVLSVFVDRVIGLTALILMAIATYTMFVRGRAIRGAGADQANSAGGLLQYSGEVLWVAVTAAAVLAILLIHPYSRARVGLTAERVWIRGLMLLHGMKEAVVVYCSKPWTLLEVLVLTFVSQTTVVVAFWLLGRHLGIGAGLRYYLVIFPVAWVVAAVPVSIAGLGVFEAAMVGMFGHLAGVPAEWAMVLALCQRFIWVLASLPGGLIHLLGAHLPQEEISVDGGRAGN